ncbi:MAG: polysaccharide deacetylase family protein [Pseudomonadota bacterium]
MKVILGIILVLVGLALAVLLVPRFAATLLGWFYPDAVIWVPTAERAVVFAIDDAPDPQVTPATLDALDAINAKAVFFVFGSRAQSDEERRLIVDILTRGHTIGLHMWDHTTTSKKSLDEVRQELTATWDALGRDVPVDYLRPSNGGPSKAILQAAEEAGLTVIVGDIIPLDFNYLSPDLYRRYLRWMVRPGSLVTFHDDIDHGPHTPVLIQQVAEDLRGKGYGIIPLPEPVD